VRARTFASAALIAAMPATGAIAGQSTSPPQPLWYANDGSNCIAIYKPVCAVKNGVRFTYSNACYAHRAGARMLSHKACSGTDRFQHGHR